MLLALRRPLAVSILIASTVATTVSAQGTFAGGLKAEVLRSPRYSFPRQLWVYTPKGYDAKRAGGYPLLLIFDGAQHLDSAGVPVPRVLDSLVAAGKIPPMVAVFLDDSSGAVRTGELGNSAKFGDFIVQELMPWVRRGWNVTHDPARTIVVGSSAGGLGAAYFGVTHPELFGNVLAQSPAVWRGAEGSNAPPYEYLRSAVARSKPPHSVTMLVDVGAEETGATIGGAGPVFIEAVRRFVAAARASGDSVIYTEIPGGKHWPETWQPRFPGDLVAIVSRW